MKEELTLEQEASSILELLDARVVSRILRPRPNEICIEFSDGTRFYIDSQSSDSLSFSVTGGPNGE